MVTNTVAFLGKGWSFPPSFDNHTLSVDVVEAAEDIRQSLFILLNTEPGQRIMNTKYGCALRQFVFEIIDLTTLTRIREVVKTAILNFEPRVDLVSTEVGVLSMNEGIIFIELTYMIRSINSRYNVVFPYYFSEATLLDKP